MQMLELKFTEVVFAEKEKSWNPKSGPLKRATFLTCLATLLYCKLQVNLSTVACITRP